MLTLPGRSHISALSRVLCPAGNGIHAGRAPTTGHPWPAAPLLPLPGCASAASHEELRAAHQPSGQVRPVDTK